MHIALLHYAAPPVVGGVESVLGHQARLLAEAGHTVRVIAGRGAQTDPRIAFVALPWADSRHPDLAALQTALNLGQVPADFAVWTARLEAALGEALAGCDVVIAHNVCSLNKNLALTAALHALHQRPGAPRLILWHHDLAWVSPRYQPELHPGQPWDLLRTAWPEATQVAISELRQRELAGLTGLPPRAIHVVPNGLDHARFLKLAPRTEAMLAETGLLQAAPVLLLPVRLTPRKNIELALGALAALRPRFPEAALLVTGPLGPHHAANHAYFARLLERRAELGLEGAAHFLAERLPAGEYLPDEVIADCYRLADALILPSREEGFGLPILEAGLSRLPIFCADLPPLRALAGPDAVYFSPEADPAEVAQLLAAHFQAASAWRLAARVRRHFTWEGVLHERLLPLLIERT